jgi:hypothetical protein
MTTEKTTGRNRSRSAETTAEPGDSPGTETREKASASGVGQGVTTGTAAPAPPDDPQVLRHHIERTREQLRGTVEALAAKADVKTRVQDKASQLTGRLKTKTAQARQQAVAQAGQVQHQLADKTAGPRRQAGVVAKKISAVTPEPLQRAVAKAAATARQHRVPLAAAIGAALVAWQVIARGRRR